MLSKAIPSISIDAVMKRLHERAPLYRQLKLIKEAFGREVQVTAWEIKDPTLLPEEPIQLTLF